MEHCYRYILLPIICMCLLCGCAKQYTDEENVAFLNRELEENYRVEFDYVGKETDSKAGITYYCFVSDAIPDLTVRCTTTDSWDQGAMMVFPFEHRRVWESDLREQLQSLVWASYDNRGYFEIKENNVEETMLLIVSFLTDLNIQYEKFHIDINEGVWIDIAKNNSIQSIQFSSCSQEHILKKLNNINWDRP